MKIIQTCIFDRDEPVYRWVITYFDMRTSTIRTERVSEDPHRTPDMYLPTPTCARCVPRGVDDYCNFVPQQLIAA